MKPKTVTTLSITWTKSPIGFIRIAATPSGALAALVFDEQWQEMRERLARRFGAIDFVEARGSAIADRLCAYFEGDMHALDAIEVDAGGTVFQRRVWRELGRIAAGETRSYAQIAQAIGAPAAVRAVGAANGQNPVSLVVPCHRVIGADGTLTGYAGGIARKRWLLDHETRATLRESA
jgi:methylated-DNA-[protein]-cysteine S-methyltransferase